MVRDRPTVAVLTRYLTAHPNTAVILTDDAGLDGTTEPAWPHAFRRPRSTPTGPAPAPGRPATRVQTALRTYRLSMDMAAGQAPMPGVGGPADPRPLCRRENGGQTAAVVPWEQLDEFYRGSKPPSGTQRTENGRGDRRSHLEYLGAIRPMGCDCPAARDRTTGCIAPLGFDGRPR